MAGASALLAQSRSTGQSAVDFLLPDLQTLPPSEPHIDYDAVTGERELEFTNTALTGGEEPHYDAVASMRAAGGRETR